MLVRQGGEEMSWEKHKASLGRLKFTVALAGLGIAAFIAVGIYRIFLKLRKQVQDETKGGEQAPHHS